MRKQIKAESLCTRFPILGLYLSLSSVSEDPLKLKKEEIPLALIGQSSKYNEQSCSAFCVENTN